MANPNCRDKESAERAVNEVWESCFNDTRPFDEVCLEPYLACSPILKSVSRYINSVSGGTISTPDLIKYFTAHIPLESALILCSATMIILRNHMTATGYRCFQFFTTPTVRRLFDPPSASQSLLFLRHEEMATCSYLMRFYSIPSARGICGQCLPWL